MTEQFDVFLCHNSGDRPLISISQSPQSFTEALAGNTKLEMVKIPAGSFAMGTEETEVIRFCREYGTDWFKNEVVI